MQSKKRIAIIISQIDKSVSHEWVAEELRNRNYEVHYILLSGYSSAMEAYLHNRHFSFLRISYTSKFDLPKAILYIYRYIKKYKINLVHAHLFEGGLAGMCAATMAGVSKRIYTRHHSSFHHEYFPKSVKYDRVVNWLSTDIIAPSLLVKDILINKEKVAEKKNSPYSSWFSVR